MTTYTDLLPPTLTDPHAAIDWTPAGDGSGVLVVKQKRGHTTYRVTRIVSDWPGFCFRLAKLSGGTDKENEAYDVFVGFDPKETQCPCKGFQRHGGCKHCLSLSTILANGWLAARPLPEGETMDEFDRADLCNPEQDVGSTEPIEDQPEPPWVYAVGFGDDVEIPHDDGVGRDDAAAAGTGTLPEVRQAASTEPDAV